MKAFITRIKIVPLIIGYYILLLKHKVLRLVYLFIGSNAAYVAWGKAICDTVDFLTTRCCGVLISEEQKEELVKDKLRTQELISKYSQGGQTNEP